MRHPALTGTTFSGGVAPEGPSIEDEPVRHDLDEPTTHAPHPPDARRARALTLTGTTS